MARRFKCPRPVNKLVMMRTKGFHGPFMQNVGNGVCVKGQGNFFGVGGPGSGSAPIFDAHFDLSAPLPEGMTWEGRASEATVITGPDGLVETVPADCLRYQGGRVERNTMSKGSENLIGSNWGPAGNAVLVDAETVTGLSADYDGLISDNFQNTIGEAYWLITELWAIGENIGRQLTMSIGGSNQVITLTAAPTKYGCFVANHTGTGRNFIRRLAGQTTTEFKIRKWARYEVTGRSNQNPPEYVSVGVATGPELVTNGTFDSDLSNWDLANSATASWNPAGYAEVARVGGTNDALLQQIIPLKIGKTYIFSIRMRKGDSAAAGGGLGTTGNPATTNIISWYDNTADDWVTFTHKWTATSVNCYIYLKSGGGGLHAHYDDVSVKEIEHNSNVDGVKYFTTENGNTVDGNGVVTEGTGPALPGPIRLVLEPSGTNSAPNSTPTTSVWSVKSNATITDAQDTGVFGDGSAAEIGASTADGGYVQDPTVFYWSSATKYVFTVVAKQGTNKWLGCYLTYSIFGTGADRSVFFDLENGSVGTKQAQIEEAWIDGPYNGYYFCHYTATTTGNGNDSIGLLASVAADNKGGDATGKSNYVSHFQAEQGSIPTSLIRTSGGTATRAADAPPYWPLTTPQDAGTVLFEGETIGNVEAAGSLIMLHNTTQGALYHKAAALNLEASDGTTEATVAITDGVPIIAASQAWDGDGFNVARNQGGWVHGGGVAYDGTQISNNTIGTGLGITAPLLVSRIRAYDQKLTPEQIEGAVA